MKTFAREAVYQLNDTKIGQFLRGAIIAAVSGLIVSLFMVHIVAAEDSYTNIPVYGESFGVVFAQEGYEREALLDLFGIVDYVWFEDGTVDTGK